MTQKESQTKPKPLNAVAAQPGKHRITLERTYEASLKDIWDLWTTKKGFESWWVLMESRSRFESSILGPVATCSMT